MILEVDLEYPVEIHDLHNDYPVAAEKMKLTPDMFSPYCKMIRDKFGISIGQVAKLIPTTLQEFTIIFISWFEAKENTQSFGI